MKRIIFLLALLCPHLLYAQGDCGFDAGNRLLTGFSPGYKYYQDASLKAWEQHIAGIPTGKMVVSGSDTVYEIPLVFHIVHTGDAEGTVFNPSDAEIDSIVNFLNKAWAAQWPSYKDTGKGGVYVPIRFTLAKRGPSCEPTKGINRVDGRVLTNYTTNGIIYNTTLSGPKDSAVKSLSKWPPQDYYNIWLVNYIDGPSGYYAGYAFYPGPNNRDGTVMKTSVIRKVTGTGDYPSTIVHELGHAFGLYHTFEGSVGEGNCPRNTDCILYGDHICDTEPHEFMSLPCDGSGSNYCTLKPYAGVQYNFMNYTSCPDRFTRQQKEKMVFTLWNSRMGLVNSLGIVAPDLSFDPPVAAFCTPGAKYDPYFSEAGPCNVSIGNMFTSSFGNTADGRKAYLDRTCIQAPAYLVTGRTYTLSVSTMMSAQKVRAWIDYSNDGVFDDAERVLMHNGTLADEVHTAAVSIPLSGIVLDKNLRMRVMADRDTVPDPNPCLDLEYGQTEDYSVLISDKPPASVKPAMKEASISIYPNPAFDRVTVVSGSLLDVSVYGMDGRLLQQGRSSAPIDVSGLADGVYMLKLSEPGSGAAVRNLRLLKRSN